ncbi:hypothetical protein JKF63_01328 [Porcisia hertigi]|uniref:Uncharacterized protein n=1 Tax=Porcisia hertigi TaxID=2761500 RepID=A0A836IE83_9TRYP|nr:hypothetical protein JKF63_01328 [Porcisia hertigi]
MATKGEEEWADGVEDFFAALPSVSSDGKSMRRRNVEANQASVALSQKTAERRETERYESAEEARRRITAAVIGRATTKEIEAAARDAHKHKKMTKKGSSTGTVSVGPALSPSSAQNSGSSTLGLSSPLSKGDDSKARQADAEVSNSHLGKRRQKIDAKFARKEARKEEAKEHRIKFRRVLRKQRR